MAKQAKLRIDGVSDEQIKATMKSLNQAQHFFFEIGDYRTMKTTALLITKLGKLEYELQNAA